MAIKYQGRKTSALIDGKTGNVKSFRFREQGCCEGTMCQGYHDHVVDIPEGERKKLEDYAPEEIQALCTCDLEAEVAEKINAAKVADYWRHDI